MSGCCAHCTVCALRRIEKKLKRMEGLMASEMEQLNVIKAKIDDVHADVKAKLGEVRAEVSPEGQAAFDEVLAALDGFDAEIGDADGSDTPAGGEEPGDPSDTAGGTGDVPAADDTADDTALNPGNATDDNGTPLNTDGTPRA